MVPSGRKKLVPMLRSMSRRMPAESRTPKASRPRMAVMNQDQQVRGMRIMLMPLARMSSVVVMKLRAPMSDAMQKTAMLMIHRSAPRPSPGPDVKRRSTHYKKGCQHHYIGSEGRPEREHVEDGERHVGRADLYGQEIVSEATLGRGSQHEKHHDGAVHGDQAEIGFGFDRAQQR